MDIVSSLMEVKSQKCYINIETKEMNVFTISYSEVIKSIWGNRPNCGVHHPSIQENTWSGDSGPPNP